MPAGGGAHSTLLFGASIYDPTKLKVVPGASETVLYWMDIIAGGNDVIRIFELGAVSSIMNAADMIDFAVTDDAIYWYTASYVGKFDLGTSEFSYPVTGTPSLRGFGINGDYVYYMYQDLVYRVSR